MINQVTHELTQTDYDLITCNATSIVLEDHVCIYPGYVTVTGGKYYTTYSDDPDNGFSFPASDSRMAEDPDWKRWVDGGMLKNRKEFRRVGEIQVAPEGLPEVAHFTDVETMFRWLELKEKKELAERQALEAKRNAEVEYTPEPIIDSDAPVG